jgi:predicted flap endonuclease-1-like 5' DNA nuclease
MDWFSFAAGALTGWIVEWLFDLFYWRRKQTRWANDQARLQTDLTHTQEVVTGLRTRELDLDRQLSAGRSDLAAATSNLDVLEGDLAAARTEIEGLRRELALAASSKQALADELSAELDASDTVIAGLREQLARAEADNQALRSEQARLLIKRDELETNATRMAATVALAVAAAEEASAPPPDDLTIIEGIGPKIAELLNQHEIRTFATLADTSVPDLETILRGGGNRFQTANPETWPRQARLAANRDWPRLDLLKAQLTGGVRRAAGEGQATRSQPIPEPQDDLAVIEGIGPKIAEILVRNGIRTFAQLARMEPARLRLLLDEAGPAYRVADPATWPEQASWAAVGNWDRLQALKEQLDAGRRL